MKTAKAKPTISAIGLMLIAASGLAGQGVQQPPSQQPPIVPGAPRPAPRPLTFAETMRKYLKRLGASVDEDRTKPEMVVSNYPDPKGNKTTIVITNDRRKNLLGLYIYNFGNVAKAPNREEVFRYLLAANDAITIGSFFVDGEDDIGYKYLVSGPQTITQDAFGQAYLTMAAVARERRAEIRKLLGLSDGKQEKPQEVKKAAEEKPPGLGAADGRLDRSDPPGANLFGEYGNTAHGSVGIVQVQPTPSTAQRDSRIPHTAVWGSFKSNLRRARCGETPEYPTRQCGDWSLDISETPNPEGPLSLSKVTGWEEALVPACLRYYSGSRTRVETQAGTSASSQPVIPPMVGGEIDTRTLSNSPSPNTNVQTPDPTRQCGGRSSPAYTEHGTPRLPNTPHGSVGIVQAQPTERGHRDTQESPTRRVGIAQGKPTIRLRLGVTACPSPDPSPQAGRGEGLCRASSCRLDLNDPHTAVWGILQAA
ncbi:MAG TPA: hypothetical protein VJH03_05935 [Blastocatellia bacterium]|nr:hypothetical protein [Blastocatellia bacterium]